MDEGDRLTPSSGRASACFPWANDPAAELWYISPVKAENVTTSLDSVPTSLGMDSRDNQWAGGSPGVPAADPTFTPNPQDTEHFPVNDRSGSTIQRQRRELQLLMAELKDRDRELNAMAASHHKQLHAWEGDRQRVLRLEQRCARLDDELQKRNQVIRVLTQRVWAVETRAEETQKELSVARQQLCELQQKQQHISQKCQDFEEQNQSLNSTVVVLSTQVGSLQVREEELSSMLKLKDRDVTEASGHIADLTGRLRDLEASLTESRSREAELLRESEESKRRYKEAKREVTRLKEELQQQLRQSSSQREEAIRLKQELQLIHRDLVLAAEGDSWKDELLELARSKQERTTSELRCLRQVCESQRNDLQLLQLSLESAQETAGEKTGQESAGSRDELRCGGLALGLKTPRILLDAGPAAGLQGPLSGDPGVSSAPSMDGDDPLSSCSLQQLLDESRRVASSSRPPASAHNGYTTDPRQCHQCRHHPTDQVEEH